MIKVQNLTKIFRTEDIETLALDGVSFTINGAVGLRQIHAAQHPRPPG